RGDRIDRAPHRALGPVVRSWSSMSTNAEAGRTDGAIDCHAHLFPPAYAKQVIAGAERDPALSFAAGRLTTTHPVVFPGLFGRIDERIALMDQAGIERQLLSMGSPYVY